jgi:hypothetical protein
LDFALIGFAFVFGFGSRLARCFNFLTDQGFNILLKPVPGNFLVA